MNAQSLIHWLEQGPGARWLARGTLVLGLLALSGLIAFKQFRGPRSEETLRQAVVARAVVAGEGYSTPVRDPQAHALLTARAGVTRTDQPLPEVYHPPGYATVLAAALAVLPSTVREGLFQAAVAAPDGYHADYLLLLVNVLLLWLAAAQTWRLGRRLFDPFVGVVAAVGLLVSVGVWQHTVAVDGSPLAMVLLLAVFQAARRGLLGAGWRATGWWSLAGAALGGLFLTDYPNAILVPVVAAFAGWRRGPLAGGAVVLAAALVALPWLARNSSATGHVLGLAAQDVALRAGDPTADPVHVRGSLAGGAPAVSLNKVGNKTLTALQQALQNGLWSGGGLVLSAFFVAGWLYRFRRDETNDLRALATVALLLLVLAQGALNSGEGERLPVATMAPLVGIFGAGFFAVLAASGNRFAGHPRLAAAALLVLQGAPLLHALLEPRQVHFSYPPYHPAFFQGMRVEMNRRGGSDPAWMADVPAGAAWYSGQRVWAQPATLRDFFAVHAEEPLLALVLTPRTLDQPYFADLARRRGSEPSRFGEWSDVYRALAQDQVPASFPLGRAQKLADNFYVLLDPRRVPWRGN